MCHSVGLSTLYLGIRVPPLTEGSCWSRCYFVTVWICFQYYFPCPADFCKGIPPETVKTSLWASMKLIQTPALNNVDNWTKLGIISSGQQFWIMEIVIASFRIKVSCGSYKGLNWIFSCSPYPISLAIKPRMVKILSAHVPTPSNRELLQKGDLLRFHSSMQEFLYAFPQSNSSGTQKPMVQFASQ